MNVNYVRECAAFIAYAGDNKITANEFVLWHAVFNAINQRAQSNDWPDEFVPVSNSRLLSLTTFGAGKCGEETLRKTRDRLLARGLIRYRPGEKNKRNPAYQMVYFAAAPDAGGNVTLEILGNTKGNMMGNAQGNTMGNAQGNTMGNAQGIIRKPNGYGNDTKPQLTVTGREQTKKRYSYNQAWRTDERAQRAVAQNILNGLTCGGMNTQANDQLCYYMRMGITPEQIAEALDGIGDLAYIDGWLQTCAQNLGIHTDGDIATMAGGG
jgi:hypothetical protein